MSSPYMFMAMLYVPIHLMFSGITIFLFKTVLANLSRFSKQRFPPDATISRTVQPYMLNINTLLENEVFGPAEHMKINLSHVLLVSILLVLLASFFSRR